MKFKIENKIYNLGFLSGPMDQEEWKLRYSDTEGLVLTTLNEHETYGAHGDVTGKTVVWEDAYTVATGEDAKKLWNALHRVIVSENVCLDVDVFLANVDQHDAAIRTARELLLEEQRIKTTMAIDKLATYRNGGLIERTN